PRRSALPGGSEGPQRPSRRLGRRRGVDLFPWTCEDLNHKSQGGRGEIHVIPEAILRRSRSLLVLSLGLVAVFAAPAGAHAGSLTPGAVFTQTNTVPNFVAVFQRNAD